ncbi:hybrid sensor histidine kinase/response regulator [Parapusillimonas sp. SGNA-6]|nr:hybrid sensor histidine kinase/response regulator [Parapusillimonas sp. SGNA-6]
MSMDDADSLSLLDLFRQEVNTHVQSLNAGLLALEREPASAAPLEECMRAAHSLKGAARIVGLTAGVDVAHAMEECFVSAQHGTLALGPDQIDALLRGADLVHRIANPPTNDMAWADSEGRGQIDEFLGGLRASLRTGVAIPSRPPRAQPSALPDAIPAPQGPGLAPRIDPALPEPDSDPLAPTSESRTHTDRALRVTAENLNRLLSLSGESLVESRRMKPFAESMLRLKRLQRGALRTLDDFHDELGDVPLSDRAQTRLAEARRLFAECQQMLASHLVELETFDRRSVNLAQRLYDEALACRMRPFSDATGSYTRLVRDLGRSLGKQARLQIVGKHTPVDRDILERLEAPLGHLLRNAVDHGIESPAERLDSGKPAEGVVTLEARHAGGMLHIDIADDGRGIDLDALRATIVERNLGNHETVAQMSESELFEFLMLPSFTTRRTVTEISGRGVGLNAASNIIKQVRGAIRISSTRGQGTRFQLQLPLTQSVLRSLLVDIGGEPYAFPLAYVVRTLELHKDQIACLQGQQHVAFDGQRIGLVPGHQVMQRSASRQPGVTVPVIVIGDHHKKFGLVVDRFLGERMLVAQPLDPRLGKVKDIAACALLEDGSPALIVDVEDMMRSVEKLISTGGIQNVRSPSDADGMARRKHILVVDDSLTVRELERKLLTKQGYDVTVAVDGMDGWNAVRSEQFDLVLTDVDMPRMDGIELVTLIRKTPNLASTPVMIVSYKDREEDRRRGLDAGADYYLAKGAFDDGTLLEVVADLIGEAGE